MVGVPERQPEDDVAAPWWDDPEVESANRRRSEEDLTVSELVPAEWAGLRLRDRLAQATGRQIDVTVHGGPALTGVVREVGDNWFTLERDGQVLVVNDDCVGSIRGLPAATTGSMAPPPRLSTLWREWQRERRRVRLALRTNEVVEGSILRVARDHVDIVRHSSDRQPRSEDEMVTIGYRSMAWCWVRD